MQPSYRLITEAGKYHVYAVNRNGTCYLGSFKIRNGRDVREHFFSLGKKVRCDAA